MMTRDSTLELAQRAVLPVRQTRRASSTLVTRIQHAVLLLLLVLVTVAIVFPFYWMVVTALKTPVAAVAYPPQFLPAGLNLQSYGFLFANTKTLRNLANSVIVTGVVTSVSLLFNTLTGYAFAKLRFPGRDKLFLLVLATYMVPFQVVIIPLYLLMSGMGLLNTYAGIVAPYLMTAFGIFYMRQACYNVPNELREAAIVDGASELRVFWSIALPLLKPMLATLGVITFLDSWNDFLWPMLMASTPDMRTLQVSVAFLRSEVQGLNYAMAGAVITALPIIVAFGVAQRWIIAGLVSGALKE